MDIKFTYFSTPLGMIEIQSSAIGLQAVKLLNEAESHRKRLEPGDESSEPAQQLKAYLQGELKMFDLPIDWGSTTAFQRRVLKACQKIPWGEINSYGALARSIGCPGGARAVGRALSQNPYLLIVPCHRVVGSDGSLHGFSAPNGIITKAWLLQLEGHELHEGKVAERKA